VGFYCLHAKDAGDESLLELSGFIMIGSFLINLPVAMISFIVFLVWVNQSNKNAQSLSVNKAMRYTSGWSVGWYLVPVALLWMPRRVMTEIWNHSDPDITQEGVQSHPKPVETWWTLWLLSAFGYNILSILLGGMGNGLSEMAAELITGGIMFVIEIFLILHWIKVVKSINKMQDQKKSEIENAAGHCPSCGEPVQVTSSNCPLCGGPLLSPATI